MRIAVLIPIKSFDLAKGRLAGALDDSERATLARTMARGVIAASRNLPAWVVCDDSSVAALATGSGANVLWRASRGLNTAVREGVEFLAGEGFEMVIVSHADLPLATDLTWVATPDTVTIVTDRRNDGTNVMALPTRTAFDFHYGPGSADAHRREADRHGLAVRVVEDAELGWDVDLPEDLAVLDPVRPTKEHHRR